MRSTLLLATLFTASGPAHSLTINLTDLGGVGAGSDALSGFTAAAQFWESSFTDDITVNLSVKFATTDINGNSFSGSTLGSTGTVDTLQSYSNFRTSLIADVTSAEDTTATSNLQSGPAFEMLLNRTRNSPNGMGSATPFLDNDGDANNTAVRLSRANAKAVGLIGANDAATDASIGFNSNFAFDFDRSDGIGGTQFDFLGVAIHEIGHALGFFSGVDVLDVNSDPPPPPGNGTWFNDTFFNWVNSLDLFRFSTDSFDIGPTIFDWTADTRAKFFSIDGGLTNLGEFSTGAIWGDGRQASHWKDNRGLGIMDPTFARGELGIASELDFLAFDVIGFDLNPLALMPVPLPAGAWLFGSALLGLLGLRRNRI